ncbi:MAG: hypothetical protein ISS36_03705 [Candidatus Aenigmarchaeota archaeon]|nr:hypothetical protein [Candidatus Aenigmarchaeota archaeon]
MGKTNLDRESLIGWMAIIKGFISGSFIISGLVNPYGFLLQAILVVIGVVVFLDALFPHNDRIFPIETTIFFVIGAVISFLLSIYGFGILFLIVLVIISVILYLERIRKFLASH